MPSSLLSPLIAAKRRQRPTFRELREYLCKKAIRDTASKAPEKAGLAKKCNPLLELSEQWPGYSSSLARERRRIGAASIVLSKTPSRTGVTRARPFAKCATRQIQNSTA